jgi:porin
VTASTSPALPEPPEIAAPAAVFEVDPSLPNADYATPMAQTPLFGGPFLTRPKLTGDWFGLRSALADRGITFDLYGTQFYQGVASGGRIREGQYGGKFDYLANVDGAKLGLWQGFFVNLHGETRLGQTVNNIDGLLTPSNIAMSFPAPSGNVSALTGVKFTQALSENVALFLGKINTLDEYVLRFNSALGLDRPGIGGFMNTSLVFNPIAARTVPYSAAGTGVALLRQGLPWFTFSVFDPQERAMIGLQDLFSRGVVLVPNLILTGKPFGRQAMLNLGGTYSSAQYTSVDPAAYLNIPITGVRAPKETGSWSLYANVFQALRVDPADEKRAWGIFGQFGISDGDPNPIKFVANGGIAGRSLLPGRSIDTFGVGYFYVGLSSEFKSLLAPVLPQQDEDGVELFYNLAVTPWCRLTADLQVARPSTRIFDTVIIPGMRLQISF